MSQRPSKASSTPGSGRPGQPANTPEGGRSTGFNTGGQATPSDHEAAEAFIRETDAEVETVPAADLSATIPAIPPPQPSAPLVLDISDEITPAGPPVAGPSTTRPEAGDQLVPELFAKLERFEKQQLEQTEAIDRLSEQIERLTQRSAASAASLSLEEAPAFWRKALKVANRVFAIALKSAGVALPNTAWKTTELALKASGSGGAEHFFAGAAAGLLRSETTLMSRLFAELLVGDVTYKPHYAENSLEEYIRILLLSLYGGYVTAGILAAVEQIHELVHGDARSYALIFLGFQMAAMMVEMTQIFAGRMLGWMRTPKSAALTDSARRTELWNEMKQHFTQPGRLFNNRLAFLLGYGEHTVMVKEFLRPIQKAHVSFLANGGFLTLFNLVCIGEPKIEKFLLALLKNEASQQQQLEQGVELGAQPGGAGSGSQRPHAD